MFTIRRGRPHLAAISVLATVALTASGCTSGEGGSEDDEYTGGPVTMSVFAPQDPEMDLATNEFSTLVGEKFDITFEWQTTTMDTGASREKRQIALASGDYPDVFLLVPWVDQFTQAELLKLGGQGVLLPLNDLIEEHAPNITRALEDNPEYRTMATAPDGNIYGLPQWTECYHCTYQNKLWMNSEWLDAVGMEQPRTTEEMREVLRAFKTQDPNGNGEADEIPVSADTRHVLIPYFMNAFLYDPQGNADSNQSTLVLDGGRVDIQANKDGWRQGLAYLRSLYAEGLIDQAAFTQNADALLQTGNNADVPVLGAVTVLHPGSAMTIGGPDDRDEAYQPVPPLTGPSGLSHTAYSFPSVPGASFALTNKASKNVQVSAIKMMDYIFTEEGEINGMYGTEGVTWEQPGPDDVALDTSMEPLFKQIPRDPDEPGANAGWGPMAQYNNTEEFRSSEAVDTDVYAPGGYERRLFEATKLYEGQEDEAMIYPAWSVWIDPAVGSEMAALQTNIESYVQQNSVQFITGSKNLDTDWDAYVQGLEGIGLARYLQIHQQAYDQSEGR